MQSALPMTSCHVMSCEDISGTLCFVSCFCRVVHIIRGTTCRRSIMSQTPCSESPFKELSTHIITSSKEDFQILGSYLLAFSMGVSHATPPSPLTSRQHIHKQLWDGVSGKHREMTTLVRGYKVSFRCWVPIPVKLTCSRCTWSLRRNVGQKLIMWSGKWSLYHNISQGQMCLHRLARDVNHVIGSAIICLGMEIQSHLLPHELNGLKKPKSKCQRKLSRCFCWLKSKGEENNDDHICGTHPSRRVSQRSSHLGIRRESYLLRDTG